MGYMYCKVELKYSRSNQDLEQWEVPYLDTYAAVQHS